MRTIVRKFAVRADEEGNWNVKLPKNNKLLDIQISTHTTDILSAAGKREIEIIPCAWFEVDEEDKEQITRSFTIIGTDRNHANLEDLSYLKTVQYEVPQDTAGRYLILVFHFYELKNEEK